MINKAHRWGTFQLWPHPKPFYFGNDATLELYPTQTTHVYVLRFPPFNIFMEYYLLGEIAKLILHFQLVHIVNYQIDIHFISLLSPICLLSLGSPNCQPHTLPSCQLHVTNATLPTRQVYWTTQNALKCYTFPNIPWNVFFGGAKSCPKK
jgi:hypothetical protein